MKTQISLIRIFYAFSAAALIFSCKKNDLATPASSVSSGNTIAVARTASGTSSTASDSVYLMQPCEDGGRRENVAQSALPASVTTYISTNYSGASFSKAFVLKSRTSVTTGYVVVIYYNNKPVGLQFDADGNFLKVLEQREKGDLEGPGYHDGGNYDDRNGEQKDTIALTSLPSLITSYFSTNYSSDTLIKAFRNKDNSIIVLSKNNGVYATVFTASGSFVKREQLPSDDGEAQSINLAALPSVAANYLSQTYPNYVFKKAFSFSQNGTIKGYVVFIDANNTKYAVKFDASGNFVKAKVIE